MKKQLFFLVIFLFFLSGCNGAYISSPGPVVDKASDAGNNRIITFEVIGKGVEPESSLTKGQAILMAERAAVADGYRQFVEKLKGVYVEAYMKGGSGSISHEEFKTQTQSLLRGVNVKKIIHGDYGITEAVMTLRVNFTRNNMIWWPNGLGAYQPQSTLASLKQDTGR